MVAFGKKLKETQIQEWQGYYINYKLMKKKVKQYVQQIEVSEQSREYILKDFSKILDKQIEKIVLFLLKQQGKLASTLSMFGQEHDFLVEQQDGSKLSKLLQSYVVVVTELLRLLVFVEMNAIGVRKILKRFDKRFAHKFTNYYVKTQANHPYSQLRQIFKQVNEVKNKTHNHTSHAHGISAVVGTISAILWISNVST